MCNNIINITKSFYRAISYFIYTNLFQSIPKFFTNTLFNSSLILFIKFIYISSSSTIMNSTIFVYCCLFFIIRCNIYIGCIRNCAERFARFLEIGLSWITAFLIPLSGVEYKSLPPLVFFLTSLISITWYSLINLICHLLLLHLC